MSFDPTGQVALITGAARGIGQGVAEALARMGAKVVLADLNAEGAMGAARAITDAGGTALGLGFDAGVEASVNAMAAAIEAAFGPVDILINNAVAHDLSRGGLEDVSDQQWSAALNVNVMGYVRTVRAFVPGMAARGQGRVVLTSSSLAILPNAVVGRMSPYIVSKTAIIGLGYSVAHAYPAVKTAVFCPGLTSTRGDGGAVPVKLGLMDDVPAHLRAAGTLAGAVGALLDGMARGDFLISSEPDYAASIVRFAENGLDPLSTFQ